jgi:hypothetical protein
MNAIFARKAPSRQELVWFRRLHAIFAILASIKPESAWSTKQTARCVMQELTRLELASQLGMCVFRARRKDEEVVFVIRVMPIFLGKRVTEIALLGKIVTVTVIAMGTRRVSALV